MAVQQQQQQQQAGRARLELLLSGSYHEVLPASPLLLLLQLAVADCWWPLLAVAGQWDVGRAPPQPPAPRGPGPRPSTSSCQGPTKSGEPPCAARGEGLRGLRSARAPCPCPAAPPKNQKKKQGLPVFVGFFWGCRFCRFYPQNHHRRRLLRTSPGLPCGPAAVPGALFPRGASTCNKVSLQISRLSTISGSRIRYPDKQIRKQI
jgi:hypothetical protein